MDVQPEMRRSRGQKLKTHSYRRVSQFKVFTATICLSLLRKIDPIPADHHSVVSDERNSHVGRNRQQIVLTVHLSA